MIKIRNEKLNEIKQWHINGFKSSKGFQRLNELAKKENGKFWNLILGKIDKIILGTPNDLEKLLEEFQTDFPGFVQDGLVGYVFNYDDFVRRNSKDWNAYQLAEKLNVRACPYCNIQFTHTVIHRSGNKKNKITRPDFDHFIKKANNPIFGLSFFNLIPSCTTCNSKSKGSKKFSTNTHVHPYLQGFDDLIKFQLKIHNTSFFHGYLPGGSIEFVEKNTTSLEEEKLLIKARKNIEDFKLLELYQQHLDYAYDLVSKAMVYNKDYLNQIADQLSFLPRTGFLRIVTSNYIDENELHMRPLSKLTKDLCEQFDLD